MVTETRPPIEQVTQGKDLRRWYLLKSELVLEARRRGLKSSGAKFDILDRLAHFLDTGERDAPNQTATKITSTFHRHSEPLIDDTVITDSYRKYPIRTSVLQGGHRPQALAQNCAREVV